MIGAWLAAFFVTQLVEVPIYVRAQDGRLLRRLAIAFGASLLTHPIVWFVVPRLFDNYFVMAVAAETFAVLTEAISLACFRVRRPLVWSLAANAASLGVGLTLRAATGWV